MRAKTNVWMTTCALAVLCGGCQKETKPAAERPVAERPAAETPNTGAPTHSPSPTVAPVVADVAPELARISLSHHDLTIEAPKGALVTVHNDAVDEVAWADGKAFRVQILAGPANLTALKSQIEEQPEWGLKRILLEKEHFLMFEAQPQAPRSPGVFLVSLVRTATATVLCQSSPSVGYTRAQAERMLTACQSLKPKD